MSMMPRHLTSLGTLLVFTVGGWTTLQCGTSLGQTVRPARGGAAAAEGSPAAAATPGAAAAPGAASSSEIKKVKVKDPSGAIIEMPLPPGGKLPEGFTLVEGADAAKDPAKPGDASAPVKRTNEPPVPPDRKEFAVKPDEKGLIEFSFRNQAWGDLLKWLAEISNMTLDWQDYPGDYLNISSNRKYSIEETRDLFNHYLLTRGYTMLEHEGMLQIVKTEGINVALVPKVNPESLEKLPANRFVRTSFRLETLNADEVLDELIQLKSKNGQLFALSTINRIEGMDSVSNLREIKRIIDDQQSDEVIDGLAKKFPLTFVRANDAKDQLEIFLGLKQGGAASASAAMNPAQLQQMLQPLQQSMQQIQSQMQQPGAAGRGGAARGRGGPSGQPEIRLVADTRMNTLIAYAPPNKVGIIASFLRRYDVPSNSSESLGMLQANMKVYRLASLDPEQLARAIQQMDVLEPMTRMDIDKANKALIVYGSIADQYTITQVIAQLDGSARKFDVIQLRRLNAVNVAGTIKLMMGAEEDSSKNNNRSPYMFYGYDPYGGRNTQAATSTDKFRVSANVEDNQNHLLLWANENERKEINKLLVKLGEIPAEGVPQSPYRTIDAARTPETFEYLKRLQEQWKQANPNNPLILPDEKLFQTQTEEEKAQKEKKKKEEEEKKKQEEAEKAKELEKQKPPRASNSDANSTVGTIGMTIPFSYLSRPNFPRNLSIANSMSPGAVPLQGSNRFQDLSGQSHRRLVQVGVASSDVQTDARSNSNAELTAGTPQSNAAVKIVVDAKGNLVLYSDDPATLNKLEALMSEQPPPKRPYEVIYIQYDTAYWISTALEKYFKNEEDQPKTTNERIIEKIYGIGEDKKEPQLGAAKKRVLKFVTDPDTNTLIVMGADEPTMQTIRKLISIWDVPKKVDATKFRYTEIVKIHYSTAEAIVETVKEAYRDLLSSNDKAFEKGGEEGGRGGGGPSRASDISRGSGVTADGEGVTYSFSGRLSFGVDKVTNSVLISAEGKPLLGLVKKMLVDLDEAAKPAGNVEIVKLDGSSGNLAMADALKAILGIKSETQQVDPQQAQNNQPGANNQRGGQRNGQRGNQQRGRGNQPQQNTRAGGARR